MDTATGQLHFQVLGPVQVHTDGGTPIRLRRKPLELLAMLVLSRNAPVSADQLREALWGDAPPTTADAALRVHLSHLRAALRHDGSDVSLLGRTPYGYVLTVDDDALDAERFGRAVAGAERLAPAQRVEQLDAALALWRGQPYEGFDDLPGVEARRASLRGPTVHGCALLGDALITLQRFEAASAHAARWAVEFPTAEAIARIRALALYHSGDHVAAARSLHLFRTQLREEYGVSLSPALATLEHEVLTQLVPPPGACVPEAAGRVANALIERDAVIAHVVEWAGRTDGPGRVLAITGEPGLGKSAVLREVRRDLGDAIVVTGRRGDPPLTVIDDLARALLPGSGWRPQAGVHIAHGDIVALLLPALTARAATIVLDDADLVDLDSIAVLRRLVDARVGTWVTAVRSHRLADHPLLSDRDALGRAHSLHLQALTPEGTRTLARQCGWDPPDATELRLLIQATAGNPFLTAALSRWRNHGGTADDVPPQIIEHVRRMLDDLPAAHRLAIRVAALGVDDVIDRSLVACATGIDADDVLDHFETAVGLGLLAVTGGWLRFQHGLVRSAVVSSIPVLRRQAMHADAARRLLAGGTRWSRPLAHHLRESGAADLLGSAAEATAHEAGESLAVGAPLLAIDLIDQALLLGARAGLGAGRLVEWGLVRCAALVGAGRLADAQESASRLADDARRLPSLAMFSHAARVVAGPFIPTGSTRRSGAPLLSEALDWFERIGETPDIALCESVVRVAITEHAARRATMTARLRPVLERAARDPGAPLDEALACLGLRTLAWTSNARADERAELSWRATDAARRSDDRDLALAAEHAHVGDLLAGGDERSDAVLARYAESARSAGSALHGWLAARMRTTWAHVAGSVALAGAAEDGARMLEPAIDATIRADAALGTFVAEMVRTNRLGALAGGARAHVVDEEFEPVVALATMAIATAAGEPGDPAAVGRMLDLVIGTPFAIPAAAFAALALRRSTAVDAAGAAEAVVDILSPHRGELVLVDAGLSCLGPAEGYLATTLRVIGDEQASAYHRTGAVDLARRIAPAWVAWAEGG